MDKSLPRTAAASAAAQDLNIMGINRRDVGIDLLNFTLAWAAVNGAITEPESKVLIGKTGALKRYADQGYLAQIELPPGLKAAPYFPHEDYFQLTEKGKMQLLMHRPEYANYGNLSLSQFMYLHDFIVRIEAAWRIHCCLIAGFLPESRFPGRCKPNRKQHDAIWITFAQKRFGVEVEAFDWKSGNKLAQFVAYCLNSITEKHIDGLYVFVQTPAALKHYAEAFKAGQSYFPEWVKENGKWYPRQASKTIITPKLASWVRVELIRSEQEIKELVAPKPTYFMDSFVKDVEAGRYDYD
jgi:hypothetical protein